MLSGTNYLVVRFSLLLLTIAMLGCEASDGRPKPVAVSGTVLVNNQPSEKVRVVFAPQDHSFAAAGITDAQGKFSLQTFESNDGAVPGKFRVAVSKFDVIEKAGGAVDEKHYLSSKYMNPSTSGIEFEVKKTGKNEVTIEVSQP
ncbi:MAG: hypothetical protein IT423_06330 [Pirellulaceae bacterium]|nr:hypothetical protein [Pirellulaceae bacterium]